MNINTQREITFGQVHEPDPAQCLLVSVTCLMMKLGSVWDWLARVTCCPIWEEVDIYIYILANVSVFTIAFEKPQQF